jgi:archaellum component FlaC
MGYEQRAEYVVKTYEAVRKKLQAGCYGVDSSSADIELTKAILLHDAIDNALSDVGPALENGLKEVASSLEYLERLREVSDSLDQVAEKISDSLAHGLADISNKLADLDRP